MAANQVALSEKIAGQLKTAFAELGLALDSFVENLSLPDELQKILDQRIGMNMIGDMGRYTQFQVAQSIPIAAANEGGGAAGVGAGLGAGVAMGQAMMDALKKAPAASGVGNCGGNRRAAHWRNQILHQLWQAHAESRKVLPGVRTCATVGLSETMNGIEWVVDAQGCDAETLRRPRSSAGIIRPDHQGAAVEAARGDSVASVSQHGWYNRFLSSLGVPSGLPYIP